MALTAATIPLAVVEQVSGSAGEVIHLVCDCRLLVTLCGAYDDSPFVDRDIDETFCQPCLAVTKVGCPNCGCRDGAVCALCDTEVTL